jgi:hypothetical protein
MIRATLGDQTTADVGVGTKIATTGISAVSSAAGAGLLTLAPTLAAALPIAGAVIAVGALVFSLFHDSRNAEQKVETTQAVNKAAELMQQNLEAWNASNKNLATQAAALQNFDDLWQQVLNYCGQASEGDPGKRCISERQRGGKYDFFSYYRDPIANDPQAGAVDRPATAGLAPAAITASVDTADLWIPVGLLALALVVSSK